MRKDIALPVLALAGGGACLAPLAAGRRAGPRDRTVPLRPGHAGADRCAGPAGAAVPGPDPGGREAGGLSRSLPLSQLPVYDPGDGGEPAPAGRRGAGYPGLFRFSCGGTDWARDCP